MNICIVAIILTFFIYGFFYDCTLLTIYFTIIAIFTVIHFMIPTKYNSTRRKIMLATWSEPGEPTIHSRFEFNVTNAEKFLEKSKNAYGSKVTLTTVAIKSIAELLRVAPDINGRISFGKYIPYNKVDVSCLVDIEGGKDLASITVEDADKMTIEDIADFIGDKAKKVKANKGDEDHKKRTGPAKFLPTYVLAILMELSAFLSVYLGISIPAMGLKKFQFGGAVLTSVGMLGIKNTFAPFPPVTRTPVTCVVCAVEKRAIVENDQIVIAPIIGINMTVDHRYLDGARAVVLMKTLEDVFINPEKYSRLSSKQISK